MCTNLRTIRRDKLEETVLSALRERLMDPTLFKAFADAFISEWNHLQGNTAAEHLARIAELQRLRHQIERLVDATDGTPAAAVRDRLGCLEQRRLALEFEASIAREPAPRLHPNLGELYRLKVADLIDALGQEDAAEARELVRGLIDHVVLHPEGDHQRVEVHGELAAILGLAGGSSNVKGAGISGALVEQM